MIALVASLALQGSVQPDYARDLDALIGDLKNYGAYVGDDRVDLAGLAVAYRPRFKAAKTNAELLPVLEELVGELHDFHAFVGTNNASSPRLVPSGTDLVGEWRGARAFVAQVRPDSLADEAGIRAGDEIVGIGGLSVRGAAQGWLGVRAPDGRAWDWALDSALAGRWNTPRRLRFQRGGEVREATLKTAQESGKGERLSVERRPGGIVVFRPEDSLGQNDLLKDLEGRLPDLRSAKGIVLDLRDTPSGGNTTVARGLMGLFTGKRQPYQRHVVEERETGTVRDWVEYATPRLAKPITTPMVILVDRWTGSMGEGIAIGLDAMHRATVIGTRMAGLRGAVDSTTLPVSGLRVFFPAERLFHIDGTPRHSWLPPVKVTPGMGDPWMAMADRVLRRS